MKIYVIDMYAYTCKNILGTIVVTYIMSLYPWHYVDAAAVRDAECQVNRVDVNGCKSHGLLIFLASAKNYGKLQSSDNCLWIWYFYVEI